MDDPANLGAHNMEKWRVGVPGRQVDCLEVGLSAQAPPLKGVGCLPWNELEKGKEAVWG